MAKDKFLEQYPDYQLIPEKGSKAVKYLIRLLGVAGLVLAVGATYYVLQQLGQVELPTPNQAGVTKYSLAAALNVGKQQLAAKEFEAAAISFKSYFAWGGDDPEAMTLYSKALSALGLQSEARYWESKASRARVKALEGEKRER